MKRIFHYLTYLFLRFVFFWLYIIPHRWAVHVGKFLGWLAFHIVKPVRVRTRETITLALGDELSEDEIDAMVRRVFTHYGLLVIEFLQQTKYHHCIDDLVDVTPVKNASEKYHARGKGIIWLTGHMGSWELMGYAYGFTGERAYSVSRAVNNPFLNRWIDARRESSGGLHIIDKNRNALRAVLKAFKDNESVAFFVDQDGRTRGIFAPFFGRPSSTLKGHAELHLRRGTPIVPVRLWRDPNLLRHHFYVGEEVTIEPSGDEDADVLALVTRCNEVLEKMIRMYPDQYLWAHRLWKTKPSELAYREQRGESADSSSGGTGNPVGIRSPQEE